jgi:diguanylate cyclase (GGDEF)-like protein
MFLAVALQAYFIADPAGDVGSVMGIQLFAIMAVLLLDSRDRWVAVILAAGVLIGLNLMVASGNLQPTITLSSSGKAMFSLFIWFSVSIIISLVIIATMGAMRREPRLLQQIFSSAGDKKENDGNDLSYFSTHDNLTGLYNRLFFETEFTRLEKSRLYPISIIMAKVDNLDDIKTSLTSQAADKMLMDVASMFSKVFRQEDIVSRYAADEYAVLLPSSNKAILDIVMERMYKNISKYYDSHKTSKMCISFGTATTDKGESLKAGLKTAEKAMRLESAEKSKAAVQIEV